MSLDKDKIGGLAYGLEQAVANLVKGVRLLRSAGCLGDFTYNIREHELKGWDGPKVKAWGEGCVLIDQAMKVLGERE
jgi:hypothetical protein